MTIPMRKNRPVPQRIRRTVLSAAVAGLAAAALAGCNTAPGAAAIIGNQRISNAQVTGYVRDALSNAGYASSVPDPAALARKELSLRIQQALFEAQAAQEGVSVSDANVNSTIQQLEAQAGGKKALDSQALQSGIAPSDIATNVRVNLLVDALARKAGVSDPTSTQGQQQANAIAVRALQTQSARLGVRVNPRYGAWDPRQFGVAPHSLGLARAATT